MPRKNPEDWRPFHFERGAERACSIIRLFRANGTQRARATVVVVGPRSSANNQLTDVLISSRTQVLQVESTESLGQVLDAFSIDVVIFSARIPRLQIASLTESMKGHVERPELFALVENASDGAWLSHFGVTSLPQRSDWESIRGAILRRVERST